MEMPFSLRWDPFISGKLDEDWLALATHDREIEIILAAQLATESGSSSLGRLLERVSIEALVAGRPKFHRSFGQIGTDSTLTSESRPQSVVPMLLRCGSWLETFVPSRIDSNGSVGVGVILGSIASKSEAVL
jgi:hypothetical protein